MFFKLQRKGISSLVLAAMLLQSTVGCSLVNSRPVYSQVYDDSGNDDNENDGSENDGSENDDSEGDDAAEDSDGSDAFESSNEDDQSGPQITDSSNLEFVNDENGMHWFVDGENATEKPEYEPGANLKVDEEIEKVKKGDGEDVAAAA